MRIALTIATLLAVAACTEEPKPPPKSGQIAPPPSAAPTPPGVRAQAALKLRVEGSEPRMATQVGTREPSGELVTTGRSGVLAFGPYVKWPPGSYQVVLYGKFLDGSDDAAWIDVAGGKGSRQFAKASLKKASADARGALATVPFKLDQTVEDLEVRVVVTPATRLAIKAYEIGPAP